MRDTSEAANSSIDLAAWLSERSAERASYKPIDDRQAEIAGDNAWNRIVTQAADIAAYDAAIAALVAPVKTDYDAYDGDFNAWNSDANTEDLDSMNSY